MGSRDLDHSEFLRQKHVDSKNRTEQAAGRCFPRDLLGVSRRFSVQRIAVLFLCAFRRFFSIFANDFVRLWNRRCSGSTP